MADSETDFLCLLCNKEGALRCAGCKEARYCSNDCQKVDWSTHKLLCKSAAELTAEKRPSPLHLRSIIFPEKEPRPRFVWLKFFETWVDNETTALGVDLAPLVRNASEAAPDSTIIANGVTGRTLHKQLSVCFLQTPTGTENMSFNKIDTRISEVLKGSVLVYGFIHDEHGPFNPQGLTTSDLRHIIDEFAIRSDIQRRLQLCEGPLERSAEKSTVVMINCYGDQNSLRLPIYQSFDLRGICEFTEGYAALEAIGIPLRFHRLGNSVSWHGRKTDDPLQLFLSYNSAYTWLTDPATASLFSLSPCEGRPFSLQENQANDHGSCFVARIDGKPLYPVHVKAISTYLMNIMNEYREEMASPVARTSFGQASMINITRYKAGPWLAKITRQRFEAFYDEFVKREDVRQDHPGLSEMA